MAVISYNESKNGKNNSLIVHGNKDELKKVAEFVNSMYDEPCICEDNTDKPKDVDMVNEPPHYAGHGMECIDEMILLYGKQETMSFCKLNAHKYRKRALYKGGEEDQEKSDWYLRMYITLNETGEGTLRKNTLKKNGIYVNN